MKRKILILLIACLALVGVGFASWQVYVNIANDVSESVIVTPTYNTDIIEVT